MTLPGLALVSVLTIINSIILIIIIMLAVDNDTDTQRHSAEDNGKLTSKTIPVDQGRSLEHTRTCNADPVNKSGFYFPSE